MDDYPLRCNQCGLYEEAPYDVGDKCVCGGVFVQRTNNERNGCEHCGMFDCHWLLHR